MAQQQSQKNQLKANQRAHEVEHAGVGHPEPGPNEVDHDSEEHHIVQPKTYWIIISLLMVLLIITVVAAKIDFGHLNAPVAVIIAMIKAALIMMYFMHVKFGSKLTKIFSTTALFFVLIMFIFTFSDYFTRGLLGNVGH